MDGLWQSRLSVSVLFVLGTCVGQANAWGAETFDFRDGDRVVFLGDALVEQEQYAGWIELMMTAAFPEQDVTFRNLGWSADTPSGKSRFGLSLLPAGRAPAGEGWKQLVKQLEFIRPTVIVFGYGMASSLEGGIEGVAAFAKEYQRLIHTAELLQPGVRCVFLSPIGSLSDTHQKNQPHILDTPPLLLLR